MKLYFQTLGCDKNMVDTEKAAALARESGHSVVFEPEKADIFIVNTCGFINSAKRQSIDAILSLAAKKGKKKKLVVTGCLTQRYSEELAKEMPEIDAVLGVNDYSRLPEVLETLAGGGERPVLHSGPSAEYEELCSSRFNCENKKPWTMSVKIAEGCDNRCSYCSIPYIRGGYRSRRPEAVLEEVRAMASEGCRELMIVAQDVTRYGSDLGIENALPELLRNICAVDGIHWVRLLYCYEDEITQELINVIKEEPKICKYLDIPIQHSEDKILKAMNRRSTRSSIGSTIKKLRKQIPGIVIRTTLITGFPGETEEQHKALIDFVRKMRFERLGVFEYSAEDGTAAAMMEGQVHARTKIRRRGELMKAQMAISKAKNDSLKGKTLECIIDDVFPDGSYMGRTYMDAPDIDNSVIIVRSPRQLSHGEFAMVTFTDSMDYDLIGEVKE